MESVVFTFCFYKLSVNTLGKTQNYCFIGVLYKILKLLDKSWDSRNLWPMARKHVAYSRSLHLFLKQLEQVFGQPRVAIFALYTMLSWCNWKPGFQLLGNMKKLWKNYKFSLLVQNHKTSFSHLRWCWRWEWSSCLVHWTVILLSTCPTRCQEAGLEQEETVAAALRAQPNEYGPWIEQC